MDKPIWTPSSERIKKTQLQKFISYVNSLHGLSLVTYEDLHTWSVTELEQFWLAVWDFCGVIASNRGDVVIENVKDMENARFFPDARLNFAENLLKQTGSGDSLVFWSDGAFCKRLSHDEVRQQVAAVAAALVNLGVKVGDRVVAYAPNSPETVIAMIATMSIGAVWSSCATDFGVGGVVDRFGQVKPKVMFCADGVFYNGKTIDCTKKIKELVEAMPSLTKTVVWHYAGGELPIEQIRHGVMWDDFVKPFKSAPLRFEQVPFNHPMLILFTSGTSGKPKCIIHITGGVLLVNLLQSLLLGDMKEGDRIFWYLTTTWMVWNALVNQMAAGATVILYDGSPFYPSQDALIKVLEDEKVTCWGTSPKYLEALLKNGFVFTKTHRLDSLKAIASSGSPLSHKLYEYVYRDIKSDVHLANLSGGTDIMASFLTGNPIGPVYSGEIQVKSLGFKVEIFNEAGKSVVQEKGELVCTAPFPTQPIGFYNDPNRERYHEAYFAKFKNVWTQGDFAEITKHNGIIIYGRSDTVLNAKGVRIGTAEIYREVEKVKEVVESVAVGQNWDNDERVILFVTLREGLTLNDEIINKIKDMLKYHASPRHVPEKILQVGDIPKTLTGKVAEIAVRNMIHNEQVKNISALVNPESLNLFKDLPELQRD